MNLKKKFSTLAEASPASCCDVDSLQVLCTKQLSNMQNWIYILGLLWIYKEVKWK